MKHIIQKLHTELIQHRRLVFVVFVFWMTATLSFFATSNMRVSNAANTNDFKAGNIISDAVMANYNAMSKDEIQAFLDSKNKCDNRNYDLYLQYKSSHPTIQWHWEGEPYNGHFVCLAQERFGDTASEIGTGKTAAEIIYEASQENHINPQVLLVLLQKESSLITDKVPNSFDYGQATGYGCPDTAACDKKYSGFKNQIYRAAELFRYTLDYGYSVYPEGRSVRVNYHPNANCGGTQVYIENRATAALYRYTPYQPNAASLSAGYGQGDSCSAYGNRNFYLYFTDWFGSTQAAVDGELVAIPDGTYALISASNSDLALTSAQKTYNAEVNTYNSAKILDIKRDSRTGYYEIIDSNTGRVLDLINANTSQDTNIHFWERNDTCAQRWRIYKTGGAQLTIESACVSGMVLEIKDSNVQLGIYNNYTNQKWQIYTGQTIQDGMYSIKLSDSRNSLRFQEGRDINGSNVFVDNQSANSERWVLTYFADGDYYTITSSISGRAIDLSNAKTTNGTNIQIWAYDKNTCAQRWRFIPVSGQNGTYSIVSACSEAYGIGLTDSRTNVGLQQISDSQTFWIAEPVARLVEDGEYRIESGSNANYVLDVSNGGRANGTNIQIWSLDRNTGAQKWQLEYLAASDTYVIKNPQSDKVIDLSNAKTINGTNIQIWAYDKNTCAQRWRFALNANGSYTIHSACNYNYVLDLSNNLTRNGTNIQIWSYDANTSAQKWFLREIDE